MTAQNSQRFNRLNGLTNPVLSLILSVETALTGWKMDMIRKTEETDASLYGFSPDNSGKANAVALNRAVSECGNVSVCEQGIYDIEGIIRLPSDTRLRFSSGVVLRRIPCKVRSLEGNLFINEGAFDGRYNENISLSGVHIVVNGVESAAASPKSKNVIAGLRGHIAFLYVRNLLIEDVMITDLLEKDYAIQISDFENVEVRRAHIEGLKDGIHFGPGKGFVVRDCKFRTYDDAIALNCADYSVSNPNFGSISDGTILNCTELPGYRTNAFFLRILTGTARCWEKGMTVYHSDAILTDKGMYRVVMRPDNTPYVSLTQPDFDSGYCELDGILWVRTHKGYERKDISPMAGCRNIVCRNLIMENPRRRGVYIYTSFDEYLRSYYSGSEIPRVSNIIFDGVKILKPIDGFLAVNMPVDQLHIMNSSFDAADVIYEGNPQIQ